jgi:hypothetical protein
LNRKSRWIYIIALGFISLVWAFYSPTIQMLISSSFEEISLQSYVVEEYPSQFIAWVVFAGIFFFLTTMVVATQEKHPDPKSYTALWLIGSLFFVAASGNIFYWINWHTDNSVGLGDIWASWDFWKTNISYGFGLAFFPLITGAIITKIFRSFKLSGDKFLPSWALRINQVFELHFEDLSRVSEQISNETPTGK